jgi:hypothetical protein
MMRRLRYSINVTLDGCCDHREFIADAELVRGDLEIALQQLKLESGYGIVHGRREAPAGRAAARTRHFNNRTDLVTVTDPARKRQKYMPRAAPLASQLASCAPAL